MSSTASPVIDLDCSDRRVHRSVSVAVLAMSVLVCASMLVSPFAWGFTLSMGGICLAIVAAGLWRLGWIGSRRPVRRVTWTASGLWYIVDGAGRTHEALLQPQSRILPMALWLHWRSGSLRFQMFMFRADIPPDQHRRLRTRVRFESAAPGHAFEPPTS